MSVIVGKRLFLVEDEPFVCALLEDIIERSGGEVAAVAYTFDDAMKKAEAAQCDAAVLDINLRGQMSYPIASALTRRGVPIVFVTGYAKDAVPQTLKDVPIVQKPYTAEHILRAISDVTSLTPQQVSGRGA